MDHQCYKIIVVVQFLSHVQLFVISWTAALKLSLSFTISWCLLILMSLESVMLSISSTISFFSSCPQYFPASGSFPMSQFFSPQVAKYWKFSFSISLFNEYSGLISFRIDWFNLLAAQIILKSLLEHHSLKASILRHSAFFVVQLSYSYMTTGKTIALTIWTSVSKVMSLLFNSTIVYFYYEIETGKS